MCENDRVLIFKLHNLITEFKQRNSVACCDSPGSLRKHSFSSSTVTQYSSISSSMSGVLILSMERTKGRETKNEVLGVRTAYSDTEK